MVLYCNRYLPDCQGQKALISGTAPLFSVSSSCTDTCPGRKAPVRHRTDRSWPRSRPSGALPPPPAAAEAEAAAVIRHTAAKAVSLRFRRVKGHVDRRRLPLRLRVQHDGHAVFPPQTAAQLLPAEGDLQYEIPVPQSQLRHRPHHLAGEGVRRDQHPRPGGVFPPEPQQLSAPVRGDGPSE